jgi:AraC family transcriptional regulator
MGARVLVMQPDPLRKDLFESIAPLIESVTLVHDPLVSLDARRILGEMDHGDVLARLAIDALMLGMLVRVSRTHRDDSSGRAPPWLKRVREMLHDEFRSPPSLATIAAVAGVIPTHLCHAFRAHVGTTLGEYVRIVRVTWAAEQLRTTDTPLSAIAAAAGYFDQSHFTRESRRLFGARPSEYRSMSRERASRLS